MTSTISRGEPATPHPPEGSDGHLLAIRGLNVYYGESHILRNVDLSIAPGQMACLIGLNGVGKTTLLKTIIGLLRQRSGSVQLEGQELSSLLPHHRAQGGIGVGDHGIGEVPRRDGTHHTDGLLDHGDALVALVAGDGFAVDSLCLFAEPFDVGRAIGDLSLRLGDGFAHFGGEDQAQVAGSLDNMFFVVTIIFFVAGPIVFYRTCKSRINKA